MAVLLTIRDRSGHDHDVSVDTSRPRQLHTVLASIGCLLGANELPTVGEHEVPPNALVGQPPLLSGSLVRLSGTGSAADSPRSAVMVEVVGGLSAGESRPLNSRGLTIGREPGNDLTLADPQVSREHLAVSLVADTIWLADRHTTNGTKVDGRPMGRETLVEPGSRIELGGSTLVVSTDPPEQVATARWPRLRRRPCVRCLAATALDLEPHLSPTR